MKIRQLIYICLISLFTVVGVEAKELKIMSWNIANLASNPGEALRGHKRDEETYQIIKGYIETYDPDVLALQEMGSEMAVRKIIGSKYHVKMEERCLDNPQKCKADNDDIYTAIAFKKSIADSSDTFDIETLAIHHTNECNNPSRKVRGAVGVKIKGNNQTIWITSIHLKATCKDDNVEPNTQDDCDTQSEQVDKLLDWTKNRNKNDIIIHAGDFNRKLLNPNDSIRTKLFSIASPTIFPQANRNCWLNKKVDWRALKAEAINSHTAFDNKNTIPRIYDPKINKDIDFFVIYGTTKKINHNQQVVMEQDYNLSSPSGPLTGCNGEIIHLGESKLSFSFVKADPSDHCPITLNLEY